MVINLDISRYSVQADQGDYSALNQCSVAKWLRQWVNLGVMSQLSDWEVVGSNPTAGMSRIGFFFIQGRNFTGFP